jgi:predicted HAD superfamily Cof-like phosphohydrolase
MTNVTAGPFDFAAMLTEFHSTYGQAIRTEFEPHPPEEDLRRRLLAEEFKEYTDALDDDDPIEVVDALGDMLYVVIGSMLTYGVDPVALMTEIHRSNMSKLGADGQPIRNEHGKVIKGPNYSPPDIAAVLGWAPEPTTAPKRVAIDEEWLVNSRAITSREPAELVAQGVDAEWIRDNCFHPPLVGGWCLDCDRLALAVEDIESLRRGVEDIPAADRVRIEAAFERAYQTAAEIVAGRRHGL